ncbi:MAG: DNA polymerase IV [Steroidobacteraceae bacterium]|jgi:DNA polymerase-4|nr:DNA polymerase IV [Steroidobacteraceae bacterium]
MAHRAILHVDMDAFYASVEQRDDPRLVGQPLIVGGTSGRGVVAAASYEVRRYGVRSAMPMRRALELCPHAVCVKPRMARYKEVSRQVFDVFHEFTPLVQGLSLDEAFLDVTASQRLKGDAVSIAREIKRRIHERTGCTASVGVAPNKLVAKIASDLDKPDGLTIVTPERIHAVLDPLPVKRLPGLGRKKGEQVAAAGIATLGELRRAPDSRLWPLFGRDGARMRERAAGIDERPVEADWEEKSISAEETFREDIADPAAMKAELARLADKASGRLRGKQLVAACVTVKIRRHDFTTSTRQRRMAPATHDSRTIARLAQGLLEAWLAEHPGARLRLLGVGVSEFAPAEQLDLFDAAQPVEATRLDAALDAIRGKFGGTALQRASSLRKDGATAERLSEFGDDRPPRRS